MAVFLPSSRRLKLAATTFVFALATTTLLWNQGRRFGKEEALRPTAAPTAAPSIFTEAVSDYATKLDALIARLKTVATREEKQKLARELAELGRGAHFQNQGEGKLSLRAWDGALNLYHELGEGPGEVDILLNRATTVGMLGEPAEAERNLRQALEIVSDLPKSDLQKAEVLCRLGQRVGSSGHYDEARGYLDRSLRIRQRFHEVHGEADCLAALGQFAYEEGQYAIARKLLLEAAQSFASLGKAPSRAAVLGQLGDVALAEGDRVEAERLYAEGLAVWEKAEQGYWVGRFLARQARLALGNDNQKAEKLARRSLALLEVSNSPTSVAWPLTVLAELAAKSNNKAQASLYFRLAREQHGKADRAFGLRQVDPLSGNQ